MDQAKLMRRLVGIFLDELEERRTDLEQGILTLEAQVRAQTTGAGDVSLASNRETMESLFRAAHSLKGAAQSVGANEIGVLCHELEQQFQEVTRGFAQISAERVGTWLASLDRLGQAALRLKERHGQAEASAQSGEGRAPEKSRAQVEPRSPEVEAEPQVRVTAPASATVRVSSAKLDALLSDVDELSAASQRFGLGVQAIGELHQRTTELVRVVRAASLQWRLSPHGGPDLEGIVEKAIELESAARRLEGHARDDAAELKHLARRADQHVRRTRMVPFSMVCVGFDRVVRDLSQLLDKDLLLSVDHEDVEVDRAVAQRLTDPLLHLLRNAATHGIEPRERRAALGKPRQGRLSLVARLHGSELEVVVEDDGSGLDHERLAARAKLLGLPLSKDEQELAQLVFAPGLSTADTVSELAGRGMGLSAVRGSVEAMHGSVGVASQPGAFTRFTLRVPVLVSALRCLFAAVAGRIYAIPCAQVLRVLMLRADDLSWLDGMQVVRVDGAAVPVVALASVLGEAQAGAPERVPVLVLEHEDKRVAFAVDEVLDESEGLLRALPTRLQGIKHLSGVTALPSGRPALVLHTGDVCRTALRMAAGGGTQIALHTPSPARRLLVVDDSLTTRTLLKSILEDGGYEVTTAQDGKDAWRMLQEQSFALVVSDVQMPNMDGLSLTSQIRASARLAQLPVILVTALGSDAERQRGMDVGATAYLDKTAFDQAALLQAVASYA